MIPYLVYVIYCLGVIWEISFQACIIWELFIVNLFKVSCSSWIPSLPPHTTLACLISCEAFKHLVSIAQLSLRPIPGDIL
jgi:hypothetical protein